MIATLLAFVIVTIVDPTVPLPQYFAPDGYATTAVQLFALAIAIVAVLSLDEPLDHIWRTSHRRVRALALVRSATVLALAAAVAVALLGPGRAVTVGVILVGLAAEAAAARRVAGRHLGWMLPTFHVSVVSVFGVVDAQPELWAWPVATVLTNGHLTAAVLTTATCLVVAATPRSLLQRVGARIWWREAS